MIEIIPAIDLMDGRCVRLTHGDFSRSTVYSDDPLEVAKQFESAGVLRLHIVDLDGARRGSPTNLDVLERIALHANLTIDFGGGIKTNEDLRAVFDAGASIANIGSVAAKEPKRFLSWLTEYGADKILLGADVKGEMIAIDGWQTDTNLPIIDYLKGYALQGVTKAFVTDVGRDGAMGGPSIDLYRRILAAVPEVKLIASGGVSSLDDIGELERIGCAGLIVGKAIYEGRIDLEKLTQYAG